MIPGVDYAFARPNPAALKAAGKQFAVRYLSGGVSKKDLTAGEIKALRAAGLSICLVWETSGGAASGGRGVGIQHAQRARAQRDALGLKGVPVYFAVDYDAQGPELTKVIAYIQGAASVMGYDQTGVYGGIKVIDAAVKAHACRWLWQTYAWSYKQWSPAAQLRQVKNGVTIGGGALDLCEAWTTDYGQWPRPVKPAPKPVPKPVPVPVQPGVFVNPADLVDGRSSDSSYIVSLALMQENGNTLSAARSLWSNNGNGAVFRQWRAANGFGSDSVAALRALGKRHGFTVVGAPAPVVKPRVFTVPPFPGKFSKGSHAVGPIKAIQKGLGLPQSGVFDQRTLDAVKAFQKRRPLLWPWDGIVGPRTYKALARPV